MKMFDKIVRVLYNLIIKVPYKKKACERRQYEYRNKNKKFN